MSSFSSLNWKTPAAISSRICSRPLVIAAPSSGATIPCATSIAQCASEPAISSAHRRWSKSIEALMRRMIAAGPPSKRPPHRALVGALARLSTSLATVAIVLLLALPTTASAGDNMRLGEFIPVTPPQPAPEVAFTDDAGKPASLGDFVGKPAVVNLWAAGCQPCLKEMPSLDRLQAQFAGKLTVAAISQDRAG